MFKRVLCCPVLFLLLLSVASCGLRNDPEPADMGGAESGEVPDGTESGRVAVADFAYMAMDYPVSMAKGYTINGEWLYYVIEESSSYRTYVSRKRMSDGYLEEGYIIGREDYRDARMQTMLADTAGNCYIFWRPGYRSEREEGAPYALSKYGADGEELWYVEFSPEELQDMGDSLYQGTVTEDGRVFLYLHGSEGCVFAFGEEGTLDNVYTPEMDWLTGVAVGREGKVYAYGSAGNGPLCAELGGAGGTFPCPVNPSEVYSGYGGGVCLCVNEGMWRHDPETGEAELLWNWKDEYMNLDGRPLRFFSDGESCSMLFLEQEYYDSAAVREMVTAVLVSFRDRRDYPGKQTITLSSINSEEYHLRMLVKLYNRQSKEYMIEIVPEMFSESLETKLMQGKGTDLVDLGGIYADNLAEAGAFEDLTAYYKTGGTGWEDILEPVRDACIRRGRNVTVIPAFSINAMLQREEWFRNEEWTVGEFLKMGKEGRRVLPAQDPLEALRYCMGVRYGEHFVDYAEKECRFDSDEFRMVLEECGKWGSYSVERYYTNFQSLDEELDYMLEVPVVISSLWDMIWFNNGTEDDSYSARMVGLPGWDGGEYAIYADVAFAMYSRSENKEGAWDFLEYMLSEELQDMVDSWCGGFPVREDSFETLLDLEDLYYNPALTRAEYESGKGVPNEEDAAKLREMVDSAVYETGRNRNDQVWKIVTEEAQMYFAGDRSLDETVQKIQNRVQLYLDENGD